MRCSGREWVVRIAGGGEGGGWDRAVWLRVPIVPAVPWAVWEYAGQSADRGDDALS